MRWSSSVTIREAWTGSESGGKNNEVFIWIVFWNPYFILGTTLVRLHKLRDGGILSRASTEIGTKSESGSLQSSPTMAIFLSPRVILYQDFCLKTSGIVSELLWRAPKRSHNASEGTRRKQPRVDVCIVVFTRPNKKTNFSFYTKKVVGQLTSQFALPPLPHLCSRSVYGKKVGINIV